MPALKKLTQMTAMTAPTSDDLLYIVNDPAGTPGSFKITVGNFFNAVATSALLSLSGLNLGTSGGSANTITCGAGLAIIPAAAGNVVITLSGGADFLINTTGFAYDSATGNVGIGSAISASYRLIVDWATTNHRHKIINSAASSVSNDIGTEYFFKNSATTSMLFGAIVIVPSVVTAGIEVGNVQMILVDAGTNYTAFRAVGAKVALGKNPPSAPTAYLQVTAPATTDIALRIESVAAGDDPGVSYMNGYVTTTNATVTTIQTVPIAASKTYLFHVFCSGRRTGGASGTADDGAGYVLDLMVTTKAGVVTINSQTLTAVGEDQAAWTFDAAVSTTNIIFRVTGAANNNISWACVVTFVEMGS